MRHVRRGLALLAAVVLIVVNSSCSSSSSSKPSGSPATTAAPTAAALATLPSGKAFIVTLVTDVSGAHDKGFNQLAWKGIQSARRKYGFTARLVESKKPEDYIRGLMRAAQRYSTLTIGVGYSMSRDVFTVAQEFPQARFALVDARPIDPSTGKETSLGNVENILFDEPAAGYLVGVVAGLMEKDHVGKARHGAVGYLGGGRIPQVTRYLAGFQAGARAADPNIKVLGDFATSFTNFQYGQQVGNRQVSRGADILFQVAAETGAGYLTAAAKKGVYGIGVDTDQRYLGPFIITSAVKRVDVAVGRTVAEVHAGKLIGGDRTFGVADGAVGFATPSSVVPAGVVARTRQFMTKIAQRKITPPSSDSGL